VGTYSGYAEHFDGWAFAAEINVGAHSDPGHEVEVLRRQQQTAAKVIAPLRDPLRRAVEHYRAGDHSYRRCLSLLDAATRDYDGPAPEPLWSSEARSRGARIPVEWLDLPEPAKRKSSPLSLSTPQRPERVDLYLYLDGRDVPPITFALRHSIAGFRGGCDRRTAARPGSALRKHGPLPRPRG